MELRNVKKRFFIIFSIALLAAGLMALPLTHAAAQESDDTVQTAGCGGGAGNPDNFQLYPAQPAAGTTFAVRGKPHDPRTVGPGSSVDLSWRERPNSSFMGKVGDDGTFTALVYVPPDFAPGVHELQYAEASPYIACVPVTVTAGGQGASWLATVPGLASAMGVVAFILNLLGLHLP